MPPLLTHVPPPSPDNDLLAVIETPKGSPNKYKYEETYGAFRLNTVMPKGSFWPYDFGFISSTVGEDGDPLDVLILMDEPAPVGCLVSIRLINSHEIGKLLKPLIGGSGFTGNAPGGLSRWSGRERKPIPLEPRLVAEVSADHIENGRFRHGSRLIRWRDDKEPRACTMDQISR